MKIRRCVYVMPSYVKNVNDYIKYYSIEYQEIVLDIVICPRNECYIHFRCRERDGQALCGLRGGDEQLMVSEF